MQAKLRAARHAPDRMRATVACRLPAAPARLRPRHRRRALHRSLLRQIARDLGVNTSTLETWLTPAERAQTHQAPNVPRLRPVTIIGTPGEAPPAMTGATLVMPSGVRICGLTIDQLTAMAKVFG